MPVKFPSEPETDAIPAFGSGLEAVVTMPNGMTFLLFLQFQICSESWLLLLYSSMLVPAARCLMSLQCNASP